jgi:hypothetical protein
VLLELGEDERVAGKRMIQYWKDDPVHMNKDGYEIMAKALAIEMLDITYTRVKTAEPSPTNQFRPQSWVEQDEDELPPSGQARPWWPWRPSQLRRRPQARTRLP